MKKRKDFHSILEEMKQVEQLSQTTFTNHTVKTSQRSRFTVKGLVDLNKSVVPQEEDAVNQSSMRPKKPAPI